MENDVSSDIGRPVRITSIGFANGKRLPEIVDVIDREGARGTDLIALPDTWLGQQNHAPETLEGPTIPAMASSTSAGSRSTWIGASITRTLTLRNEIGCFKSAATTFSRKRVCDVRGGLS